MKAERRAALRSVLAASELEEFDIETSSNAELLRSRLASFNPTGEEFRAVFRRIQEASDGLLAEGEGSDPASEIGGQAEGREALEEHIQAGLSASRYPGLPRSPSPEIPKLGQVVGETRLPPGR